MRRLLNSPHTPEITITLEETVQALHSTLTEEKINHEILVVNDHSSDHTEDILLELESKIPNLRHINNPPPNGFGYAVRKLPSGGMVITCYLIGICMIIRKRGFLLMEIFATLLPLLCRTAIICWWVALFWPISYG